MDLDLLERALEQQRLRVAVVEDLGLGWFGRGHCRHLHLDLGSADRPRLAASTTKQVEDLVAGDRPQPTAKRSSFAR